MIKNIIFDIGMVLMDFQWQQHMRNLGMKDEAIEALGKAVIYSASWSKLDLGQIPEEDVVNELIAKSPQYEDEIRYFFDHKIGIVVPFSGNREWLQELKAAGYKLYLLSNYPKTYYEAHLSYGFDFVDLVDGGVISYQVQCVKPNASIYQHLLERYQLKPHECVFLDDRLENIKAARTLGMQGIVVKNRMQAKKDLDALLKLCFTREGQTCVYESPVMSLWKDELELPNGKRVTYDLIKQKGGACVLPVDENGNVYLVKQYRNTLNQVNLEVPAGCYDYPGEDPLVCAKRELAEELGLTATKYEYFAEVITDIGISDEKIVIYFATGLSWCERHLDDNEFIQLVTMPYSEALQKVSSGEIVDAKTVIALLGYRNR